MIYCHLNPEAACVTCAEVTVKKHTYVTVPWQDIWLLFQLFPLLLRIISYNTVIAAIWRNIQNPYINCSAGTVGILELWEQCRVWIVPKNTSPGQAEKRRNSDLRVFRDVPNDVRSVCVVLVDLSDCILVSECIFPCCMCGDLTYGHVLIWYTDGDAWSASL